MTCSLPSRGHRLEPLGWRRGWARLREAQVAHLEASRDRLDAMEAGLSGVLQELGQLLSEAAALPATDASWQGVSGEGWRGRGVGAVVLQAPYQNALRWQLQAGLERPHAEACALLNASEARGTPRNTHLAAVCGANSNLGCSLLAAT